MDRIRSIPHEGISGEDLARWVGEARVAGRRRRGFRRRRRPPDDR